MVSQHKIRLPIAALLMLLMTCLFTVTSYAARPITHAPLPEEKAFQLTVSFIRPGVVMAVWQIAPGYYLYTDKVKINFNPETKADIRYPQGEYHSDDTRGRFQAYSGTVQIPISISEDQPPSTMTIDYQGCSKDGFCYPPMNKNFMLNLPEQTATQISDMQNIVPAESTLQSLLTNQNHVGALLHHQHFAVMMLIFMGLGLLLAFTPCVLPMVPILTSIIVGQKHSPGSKKAFLLSSAYVLGMSLTYAGAGMAVASLGGSIQVWLQKPLTIAIVSGIFLLLAFSLFGLYELRFSRRWHNWIYAWSNQHEGGTYVGVFFMGVLATLVVSPCVTAPLVGVLIYIGQTGNLMLGATALFMMGIGMGIPLLLIGMSAGRWLPKSGAWMKAVKELFGIFMVAMAIWLLSRIVSPAATQILFGLLLLGTAVFVGVYLPRLIRFKKVNRLIGLASAMFGLFLVFNGANMKLVTAPIADLNIGAFTVVHNIADLDKQLTLAQEAGRPVLLDFYADWCASCVEMDRKVFDKRHVKDALSQFTLVRVDLSENSSTDGEMLKHFDVVAPPTMIFFNNSGREVSSRRIVGELDESEFLTRIQSFVTASCDTKIQC